MQDTRQQILKLLQQEGSGTINSIAHSMELATATIRHHLTILERDGLVDVDQVRQRVGRPHLVYTLTQNGREVFPKKYDEFSTELLHEVREMYGDQAVRDLIYKIAQHKLDQIEIDFKILSSTERLDVLQELLVSEGYVSNFEIEGNQATLVQHACPYQSIVMQHPEVCLLNEYLIKSIMGDSYKRQGCLVNGDDACTFQIKL